MKCAQWCQQHKHNTQRANKQLLIKDTPTKAPQTEIRNPKPKVFTLTSTQTCDQQYKAGKSMKDKVLKRHNYHDSRKRRKESCTFGESALYKFECLEATVVNG